MYEMPKEQMKCIMPLFRGWEETLIWSCLEGYMGKAWTDHLRKPQVVLIVIGDFAFLAGNSDLAQAETLVKAIQEKGKKLPLLVIPQNKKWGDLIEKVEQTIRYATKKEPCLEKGLYPSWDAASKISISLAEKLGYHLVYEYRTYIINN